MSKTLLLGGHLVCSSEAKKCEDVKLTCIGFDIILYKSINYWSWVISLLTELWFARYTIEY